MLDDGMFQSARPRGARLGPVGSLPQGVFVSIRAPAWGATGGGKIPQHPTACFNPRARVGRDDEPEVGFRRWRVSIRAPAWGATGI